VEGKICKDCGRFKAYGEFHKNALSDDNCARLCKRCVSNYGFEYRKANKREIAHRKAESRKNKKPGAGRKYTRNSENKTARIDQQRNLRALENQAKGTFTEQEFQALTQRYNNRCYYCLMPLNIAGVRLPRHADHYVPLSKGGHNDISNIVPACKTCNLRKGVRLPWEFKEGETFNPKTPEQWRLENFKNPA
jgi:5-methylcytosine-specific restriction endonuclease McrA